MKFNLKKSTILINLIGSRALGTQIDSSDVDVGGVYIPPKEYYIGFLNEFEQDNKTKEKFKYVDVPSNLKTFSDYFVGEEKDKVDNQRIDGSIYEISKFFRLGVDSDTFILVSLFAPSHAVRYCNEFGKELLYNRDLFLSKNIYKSILKRAQQRYRGARNARDMAKRPKRLKPDIKNFTDKNEYKVALKEWRRGFCWDNSENLRVKTIKKYGYDVKYAVQSLMFLRFGKDLLLDGKWNEDRGVEDLREIRHGGWLYDRFADQYKKELKDLELAFKDSTLPNRVNSNTLNDLCIDITERFLGYK